MFRSRNKFCRGWHTVLSVAARTSMHLAAAGALRVSPRDIRFLKRKHKQLQQVIHTDGGVSPNNIQNCKSMAAFQNLHNNLQGTLAGYHQTFFYNQGTRCRGNKWWHLFLALQPWSKLSHRSICQPSSLRAALYMAQVFGAMMTSAFFFVTADGAQSATSSSLCQTKTLAENVLKASMVGIASAFMSPVPVYFLGLLHRRDFVYVESEDDPEVSRTLLIWRIQDMMLLAMVICYVLFCCLFVSSFLANVQTLDQQQWLVSCAAGLVKGVLVTPGCLALVFVCIAKMSSLDDRIPERVRRFSLQPMTFKSEQAGEAASHTLENGYGVTSTSQDAYKTDFPDKAAEAEGDSATPRASPQASPRASPRQMVCEVVPKAPSDVYEAFDLWSTSQPSRLGDMIDVCSSLDADTLCKRGTSDTMCKRGTSSRAMHCV